MWVSRAATGVVAYGWCSNPDALLREFSRKRPWRAVRRDEKDAYSHFALAMTYVFLGDLDQAVRASEKATRVEPELCAGPCRARDGAALFWRARTRSNRFTRA